MKDLSFTDLTNKKLTVGIETKNGICEQELTLQEAYQRMPNMDYTGIAYVRNYEPVKSGWISVDDKPAYGVPVILIIKGVVQHVTYMLDGADDSPDWFEPFHFDHDSEETLWAHQASHWQYLPCAN